MSKSEQNINDVQFILSQVEWFLAKSAEELISHFKENKMDVFWSLPHPEGKGMLFCGYEAYQRFYVLAKRFLSSHKDKATNVYLGEYVEALCAEFVRRFVKEAKLVDAPGWGAVEDRGPMWEAITAICLLQAGVDIIRMRHPRAVEAVRNFINQVW